MGKRQQLNGPRAQHLVKLQPGGQPGAEGTPPQRQAPTRLSHLREWLGVVLVPLMILAYTIVNNTQQAGIAADMRKVDVERQESQQQEAVLSTYIHDINDLIFSHGLYTSKSGEQVRVVARAQTLAALRQLNGKRKGVVLQFLSESGLITGRGKQPETIISLDGADLSGALLDRAILEGTDLDRAILEGAHLSGAILRGASLKWADLKDAHLEGAYLEAADLRGARLDRVNLSGAVMPDGTKHP